MSHSLGTSCKHFTVLDTVFGSRCGPLHGSLCLRSDRKLSHCSASPRRERAYTKASLYAQNKRESCISPVHAAPLVRNAPILTPRAWCLLATVGRGCARPGLGMDAGWALGGVTLPFYGLRPRSRSLSALRLHAWSSTPDKRSRVSEPTPPLSTILHTASHSPGWRRQNRWCGLVLESSLCNGAGEGRKVCLSQASR